VFLDKEFRTLKQVLEFLAEHFAKDSGLDKDRIFKLLMEREELTPTWIGNGTILPHNHSPEVKDLNVIFIRCKKPLILDDGNEVKYIFSILTSGSQENLYIGILQGIGKLIQEQSREVDLCQTPAELLELLVSSSNSMGGPLTAADLARPWPSVHENKTLSFALDIMKKNGVYFLPVLSEQTGRISGFLDLIDLLKAGFPDYVFKLNNISMIRDFQPVKYFWQNENDLIIKDLKRDYKSYMIRSSVTYPEIFFMMIKDNIRHLLVLSDQDELIGVIHPNEIINKMLRP